MRKLRLGIIGCGEITKFTLVFAKMNPFIQVTGCADLNIKRAGKYAAFFKGARAYADYKDMINNVEMDAAYIAIPHHLHYPVMKELINRGIHVMCEKPVTTCLEDAGKVVELARNNDVKVGVNYQYRYDKDCYRMVKAAQNGDLGNLYYGICNIPWNRSEKYFLDCPWHCSCEEAGGGTLITQGSHALDILLWAFGSPPVRATGVKKNARFSYGDVEDLCMGIVELENGAVLQLTSSMVAEPEQPLSIQIYGSEGTAIYTGGEVFSSVKFLKAKVPKYRIGVNGVHALGRSMEAFRKWVAGGPPYHSPVEDAIPVLATVLAVYRSAETSKAEEVGL